jgi:hypothetical protein
MEIYQDNRIVPFAGRDVPVIPVFRRAVAGGENVFEIFAVGHFGGIKTGSSKEVNRQEERPEVT